MLSDLGSGSVILKGRGGSTTRSRCKVDIVGYSHYGPNLVFHEGIIVDIVKVHSGRENAYQLWW
jgi:hypothetical protein